MEKYGHSALKLGNNDTFEEIFKEDSERKEVIEKDSTLWRASECDSAVKSPIVPIEPKSIGPEEEPGKFGKICQMNTTFVM